MASEKKIARHSFEEGVNTVLASEALPNNFARYMLNANILSQGEGNIGIVTLVKGNKQVPFGLPSGANTCIGHAVDLENNKFYFFNHNSTALHGIYQFEKISGKISEVIINKTDTGNIDLLNFSLDYPILHAEVIKGRLYWVDGLNSARNFNIARMMDKGVTGYGIILDSYINAYKQTDSYAPVAEYDSDVNYPFNKLYGTLRRFAIRYVYDDGSLSNVSDFSNVPVPSNESFTGVPSIPTANNVINVKFNTGDKTVVKIQVLAQATDYETSGALLPWVIIANIDKDKTGVSDNSQYIYKFYNDVAPLATDNAKVIRPYSFLPKRPLCMAFVKNAITYANGYTGFGDVDVDASASVTYSDLFIEDATENEFNEPLFTTVMPPNTGDYVSGNEFVWDYNNVQLLWPVTESPTRFNIHEITVGHDVKKGNKFSLRIVTAEGNNFLFEVTATNTDSALSIANKLKQQLTATGWVYRKTDELPDTNIFDNTIAMNGDVTFRFIFRATRFHNYPFSTAFVNPVQFNTLKDTGQSVSNIKMGSITKYGFMYEDIDGGRKSLVYTDDSLIVPIDTYNEQGGIKQSTITLTVSHLPPVWARRYQVVRSIDFVYNNYIQLLIQKVSDFNDDDAQAYLDLAVGSLYTFQKVHPNSTLRYEFKKGDRLRLMKNVDTETVYDFFETEIIAFNPTVTDRKEENFVTNNTNSVTVQTTSASDIDKFILLDDGTSRKIIDVPDGTHYTLDSTIGNAKTYTYYDLIDYRGSIRIRKPIDITITDNSLVEIYTPSSLSQTDNIQFFEFQKKFEIIGAGTAIRYHAGDTQDQTNAQPAIIKISDGTAYVRNRELPVNNSVPGTQVLISVIEDPSYSDFYSSLINDNGRINVEDTGDGEVHFGSRVWHSGNFIEDTRINGLNDFDNSNREDYNDQYGDIVLTKFDTNLIYTFKHLKTAYIPVDSRITQDSDSLKMNIASGKLLNPIQYFSWEGGIGNNPGSYAFNGTHRYFVSVNSGVIIRLGGNGAEPVSKTFFLDNEVKRILSEADANRANIIGGFDRKNSVYIVSVEGYEKYIYFDGFNAWITENDDLATNVVFEVVTAPSHGATVISGSKITYTPTTDYVGSDTFTYRVQIAGVWQPAKNVCLNITAPPVNLAWRGAGQYCAVDVYGLRTQYKGWTTLEQYDTISGDATGLTAPNNPSDPRYIAPVYDDVTCAPNAIINWFVAQLASPYIDSNLAITQNGTPVLYQVVDGNDTLYMNDGDALSSEAFTVDDPIGATDPILRQVITKDGVIVYDNSTVAESGASLVYGVAVEGGSVYNINVSGAENEPTIPTCPDRRLVIQICNSNASKDDNFDVYLNGLDPANLIGSVDLSENAQKGSVFVASLTVLDITEPDFACPMAGMTVYEFDPALVVGGVNTIYMVNTQNNGNSNYGSVGVRNYEITGSDLANPCVVANLLYSGASGSNFELAFDYTACCPGDV